MGSCNTVDVLAFSNVKAEYMRQCEGSSRTDLTKVSHFEAFLPFNTFSEYLSKKKSKPIIKGTYRVTINNEYKGIILVHQEQFADVDRTLTMGAQLLLIYLIYMPSDLS